MSDQAVRIVWFGVLLVHGLGHFGALAALAWLAVRPESATGAWTAARSWLVPSLAPGTATIVASAFWIASLVGFVAAALLFWFGSGDAWQPLAIASAVVSTLGIVLFFGTWPIVQHGRRARGERRGAGRPPRPALDAAARVMSA